MCATARWRPVPWSVERRVIARVKVRRGSHCHDVVEPGDDLAVLVGLLDGDVGHEAVGGGAVPVLLAGFDVDDVAGADLLDGRRGGRQADAVGDVQGLALGGGCARRCGRRG